MQSTLIDALIGIWRGFALYPFKATVCEYTPKAFKSVRDAPKWPLPAGTGSKNFSNHDPAAIFTNRGLKVPCKELSQVLPTCLLFLKELTVLFPTDVDIV